MNMQAIVETTPYVFDIGAVLLLAAAGGFLARKIGLPAVVGYLVVGLVVSPFTPGYVASREQIAILADIGVVLLLFEVGIEVDLGRVRREQGALLWMAPLQVVMSTALATGGLLIAGVPILGASLLALGLAMSSSVVIVNVTRSRRRTTNPQTEDALLAWSVLQDVTGVALAAILLAVFGAGTKPVGIALGGLVLFALFAYAISRMLPRLLPIVRWEHDLFLIVSVGSGLAVAALGTMLFDVPMALAAFVAGLALNPGRDTEEVRRVLLPFRDLFAVLFFVVIGSLIQPAQLGDALPFVALLVGMMLVFKSIPIALLAKVTRFHARPRQLAIGLSQLGEFSFVLGSVALAKDAITEAEFVAILVTVVVTIIASTTLVRRLHTT